MASRPKGREHPNIGLQLHYPVNFSFIRRGRMEERKVNPAKGPKVMNLESPVGALGSLGEVIREPLVVNSRR